MGPAAQGGGMNALPFEAQCTRSGKYHSHRWFHLRIYNPKHDRSSGIETPMSKNIMGVPWQFEAWVFELVLNPEPVSAISLT